MTERRVRVVEGCAQRVGDGCRGWSTRREVRGRSAGVGPSKAPTSRETYVYSLPSLLYLIPREGVSDIETLHLHVWYCYVVHQNLCRLYLLPRHRWS